MAGQRFDGKVVLVTGAAQGFGLAFSRAFHAAGAEVALIDVNIDEAEREASELTAAGSGALAVRCDVSDEADARAAVDATVARFGRLDVLINNAGLHLTKYNQPFGSLGATELRRLLDVNVVGVVNCALAASQAMAPTGGGVIANISSIGGYLSTTPYGVSKLAVRGLTVALASELAPIGVRVNAIAPGLMATENAIADLPPGMVADFVENRQLIPRLGGVDDVVSMMLFLCSDSASFVTGETVRVSGGYPLGM
ncbi:SDR family NAD(P)-dependent oxidoreductase [Tomitella biformata]|uniref:SDR family NAD(P)-dependent oxidoreductase n=1 Tax=Tomitella biformata TaxID=630403 RepID=UPI00046384E9|nr:SDR family oxidoreductase [Tomitella biformata]